MPKKKKFIDKKKAITFHLVHRSQHDPLVADEKAPQRVLLPVQKDEKSKKKNKDEEQKYGIYFDDEYDYLQHLRDVEKEDVVWLEAPKSSKKVEQPSINLPSSVFASNVEEDIGLLNKAAPQSGLRLDLDPDVVAAMDEDFDYSDPDNELEDNFIELANAAPIDSEEGPEDDDYEEEDIGLSSNYSSEEDDEIGSLRDFDTQSRFTDYSMSSSVITRNSQLTLLDETFEQMFANYDESEIGALDCEEIEGDIDMDSQLFKMAADEFEKERQMEKLKAEDIEKVLIESSDESDEERNYLYEIKEKRNWDCESILSTYSNLYNHPKLIKEPINRIQVDKRTGIPMESGKLTKKALAQLDNSACTRGPASMCSTLSMLSLRDKNETPEEKKERKRQLREYRKARRMERKANSIAFKEEKRKLEKTMVHNKLNRQGIVL